jgi:hypothetical protein
LNAVRSWKLVVAGIAAAVVVGGGIGMSVMQMRAGDANEPGPPNIDTRSWVTERNEAGWLVRHPREWTFRPFKSLIANQVSYTGATISNRPCEPTESQGVVADWCGPPDVRAAVRIVHVAGGPLPPNTGPDSVYPLALEQATRDPAARGGHLVLRLPLVRGGDNGWELNAWIGSKVKALDAEVVRRVVSSFGFEDSAAANGLTLEERIIAHEIAESYSGARRALKGRAHTHIGGFAKKENMTAPCDQHRCGLVVFQITGGLRFRVLVDLTEKRAIAFR